MANEKWQMGECLRGRWGEGEQEGECVRGRRGEGEQEGEEERLQFIAYLWGYDR